MDQISCIVGPVKTCRWQLSSDIMPRLTVDTASPPSCLEEAKVVGALSRAISLSRKRKLIADDSSSSSAVRCRADLWTWPNRFVGCLPGNNFRMLHSNLLTGVRMTTDLSGFDMPRFSAGLIKQEVQRLQGSSADKLTWSFDRSSDCAKHCRKALILHGEGCVLGSSVDRVPSGLVTKFKELHTKAMEHVKSCLGQKARSKALHKFWTDACSLMLDVSDADVSSIRARCYSHGSLCPLMPRKFGSFKGVKGSIGGFICVDWSNFGKRAGLLGYNSTLSTLIYLRERLLLKEHFCIIECVTGFPDELLQVLSHIYSVDVIQWSSHWSGLPGRRKRKFMFLLNKGCLRWMPGVQADIQDVFNKIFSSDLDDDVTGDLYFGAPKQAVVSHSEFLAKLRFLPPRRNNGKPWSCFQLLKPGGRNRLLKHEAKMRKRNMGLGETVFCDLSQNISFRPPTTSIMPTLLRSSEIWSTSKRRLLLPLESLEVMGFGPMYLAEDYRDEEKDRAPATETLHYGAPLMDALRNGKFSPRVIRQLAGNSMQASAIGACQIFVLAFTEPVQQGTI